jgi:hypothetical protein
MEVALRIGHDRRGLKLTEYPIAGSGKGPLAVVLKSASFAYL